MMTDTLTEKYIEFRLRHDDEPDWIYQIRKAAWDKYQTDAIAGKNRASLEIHQAGMVSGG